MTPMPIEPIVKRAIFAVRCRCGAAMDSAKETAEDAIAEVELKHRCPVREFVAEKYAPR